MHKIVVAFGIIVWCLSGCISSNKTTQTSKITPFEHAQIIDLESIKTDTTIELNQKAFAFEMEMSTYSSKKKNYSAYMIAAFTDDVMYSQVKKDMKISDISCFRLFGGLAAPENGYDQMFVHSYNPQKYLYGFHYIMYGETKEDSRRAVLLKKQNGMVRVQAEFNQLNINGKKIDLDSFSGNTLYILALYDNNRNNIIDAGELKRFRIHIYL
jgi:hypothetical protein